MQCFENTSIDDHREEARLNGDSIFYAVNAENSVIMPSITVIFLHSLPIIIREVNHVLLHQKQKTPFF